MIIANNESAIELLEWLEIEMDVLSYNSSMRYFDDKTLTQDARDYIDFVEKTSATWRGLIMEFLSSYSIQKGKIV